MKQRTKWAYFIYKTAYHNGGLVSRHRSLDLAKKALNRLQSGNECICGCYYIVKNDATYVDQDTCQPLRVTLIDDLCEVVESHYADPAL